MNNFTFDRPLQSVQDICRFIEKGELYLNNEYQNDIEILNGIILNPPYQRTYRASKKEESLIIDSIIKNIPIPEVFFIRIINNNAQLRNVMDGKHRLTAIYRFVNNKFALTGLDSNYNGKYFDELEPDTKINILSSKISILEFSNVTDKSIEIELFKRYNKQTKPLSDQEILNALYTSKTSEFVTHFVNKTLKEDQVLTDIYNNTSDRVSKQKIHQNIFSILYILKNGVETVFNNSTQCSEMLMKHMSQNNSDGLEELVNKFEYYNDVLKKLHSVSKYPLSNLINVSSQKNNYKFQIGIAMFMALVVKKYNFDLEHKEVTKDLRQIINKAPNMDNTFNGSSTNSNSIKEYFNKINFSEYKSIV